MTLTLEALPNELITEIAVHVASSSSSDLCNLKRTCKSVRASAEEDSVFRHVCMETIPVVQWKPTMQAAFFLKRCERSRNPEAIFRRGVVQFFSKGKHKLGRSLLSNAASRGHPTSMYLLGIILLCTDESRSLAMWLLNRVKTCKDECRNKCKMVINGLWKNHKISPGKPICNGEICQSRKIYWDDVQFDCVGCTWDYEVKLFCELVA